MKSFGLDPDSATAWIRIRAKCLDPDPDPVNPDRNTCVPYSLQQVMRIIIQLIRILHFQTNLDPDSAENG